MVSTFWGQRLDLDFLRLDNLGITFGVDTRPQFEILSFHVDRTQKILECVVARHHKQGFFNAHSNRNHRERLK